MFFRRILNNLSHPDWPTVTLEFVLVVLGIFLALQADNWNQRRLDANDANLFITSLHQDLLIAEQLTARLRERRLGLLTSLIEASDVLSRQNDDARLSDAQCFAVGASAFFNINISDLPALAELMATGRMGIIRDTELRAALVGQRQIKETLARLQMTHLTMATNLAVKYPQLISAANYLEPDTGEVRLRYTCDATQMRSDRAFLTELALNVDTYDVYYRDGLAPWFDQFDKVHRRVDVALGVTH